MRAETAQRLAAIGVGIAIGVLTFAGVLLLKSQLLFVTVLVCLTLTWLVGTRRSWRRLGEGLFAGFLVVVAFVVAFVVYLNFALGS